MATQRKPHARKSSECVPAQVPPDTPPLCAAEAKEVAPEPQESATLDAALRPLCLKDYQGQAHFTDPLALYIQAANERKEALDHMLLSGPPGLGKTTLAQIVAYELGATLKVTSGPVLEKPGDVAALLTTLGPRDVLFIDEIHRLKPQIEEVLYPAMEDFRLDIMVGEADQARAISIPLAPFTLIGATTQAGNLSAPLRDRFGINGRLMHYDIDTLSQIIQTNAHALGHPFERDAARRLAQCARGTPRIANRMLRRVRDLAQVEQRAVVSLDLVQKALALQGLDACGLDALDQRYLRALHDIYACGPVGVETLSVALGEARVTLEDSVEPYLIQQGLIQRSARGRVLTEPGKQWIAALEAV